MDAKKFGEILSLAMARVTHADGSIVDPATLPEAIQHDRATEDLWIAWGFVNVAGAGPFDDQKARIEAWAAEREQRFTAARAALERFAIGAHVGPLEDQIRVLGEQRDRLRGLADVGAGEIQRLTAQRDAARAGIAKVFQSIEADHLELVHEDIEHDKGRGHIHTAPCPEDDTCSCPCRAVMLWLQLAASDPGSSQAIAALEGLRQAGALNETTHELKAEDPDRWAFGMTEAFKQAKGRPAPAPRMYVECIVRPECGPNHARRRAALPEKWAEVGRPVSIVYKDTPLEDIDARHHVVVEVTGERYDSAERTRRQVAADLRGEDYWIVRPTDPPHVNADLATVGPLMTPAEAEQFQAERAADAEEHDHVFIDGRSACGEVMQ